MAFYGLSVIQIRYSSWSVVHISTQVSSNQPNISDKNEIKFQKRGEQRTVRFLFGFFNIFQNFLYTPQFLNRKSKYYTTNAIETMIIFKIFSRSGTRGGKILTISGGKYSYNIRCNYRDFIRRTK